MKLTQALRLPNSASVAFVGAGGKTTALFQAARELSKMAGAALVTTTTHLGDWQVSLADRHFTWAENTPLPDMEAQIGAGITLITGALETGAHRYVGLSFAQTEKLHQLAGYHDLPLLIEADGARQKALKAPAGHEPAIPPFVDTVVVVAGLSGLNQPLTDESVHRAELFSVLIGLELAETVTAETLAKVLTHPDGGLKNIPAGARRIVLLNQADTPEQQALAAEMAQTLLEKFDALVVASAQRKEIHAVYENIAGIVLAAGEASRFGKPKQLLDYHGEPFVRHVAKTALAAGLAPVIVVTGAFAGQVEAAVKDLPLVVIRSIKWMNGQSESIKAGILSLTSPLPGPPPFSESSGKWGRVGGAIFLLADQPQVTQHVIQALVERHAVSRAAIVAPLAADRRANPVLFDRDTFQDLLALTGDIGGRALFTQYTLDYVPWHDESLLFDVDTEDDYRKLLAWGVEE